jgi:hypothetical protein
MYNRHGRKVHNLTLEVVTVVTIAYPGYQMSVQSGHGGKRLGHKTFFFRKIRKLSTFFAMMTFNVKDWKSYSLVT